MPDFSVSTTQTLTLLQNTPFAEICPTSSEIETDDVRSTESQGGKETEAHQGWRKQAKSREEESGYRGTDLTVEDGFGIPNQLLSTARCSAVLLVYSGPQKTRALFMLYLKSPPLLGVRWGRWVLL